MELALMKSRVQHSLQERGTMVRQSMRTSPAKWAGLAAGAGLAMGLLGRLAAARRKHRPMLVVIEQAC